jgi:hypothetical protein
MPRSRWRKPRRITQQIHEPPADECEQLGCCAGECRTGRTDRAATSGERILGREEGLHQAPKGSAQVHDGECKFASNLRAPQVANCPRNAVGVATGSLGKNFLATRNSCLTNLSVSFAPATACCCADNFPRAVERRRPRQDRRGGWSSRPSAPATSAGELSVSFPLRHEQKEQRVDHSRDPPSTEFTCPRSRHVGLVPSGPAIWKV